MSLGWDIDKMKKTSLNIFRNNNNNKTGTSWNKGVLLCCLISAIAIITICSKSSILYPFNDWVDSNCFFTVGKSMMNGVVVYRDLLEQKGPFLYFIHGLAWMISKDTFFGVYLLEIVAAFFFLYFGYRTMDELCNKPSPIVIPIMAMLAYTTEAFHHGDSAEELCLPFLAYAVWVCVKSLKRKEEVSYREYFFVGLTAGCVFWTKFTLVGFYIGWFLVPAFLLILKKKWKQLGQVILAIIAGVFIATVPYIIYFGIHDAIGDWLKVYLYDNIFLYTVKAEGSAFTNLFLNLARGAKGIILRNEAACIFGILALLLCVKKEERMVGVHMITTMAGLFFFVYMGGRILRYYACIFSVVLPYGMSVIYNLIVSKKAKVSQVLHNKVCIGAVFVISMFVALCITPNRYLMGVDKAELPQYQFKEIIEQVENPTLLNYGFLDGGFYTVCNIIPNCKAFCQLNLPLQEMFDLQNQYAQEGLCDFIVTRSRQIDFEKYDCVAKSSFMFEDIMFDYYLYQLK